MARFSALLAIVLVIAVPPHVDAAAGGSTSTNTTGGSGSNSPTGDPCVPEQNITCSTACNSGNAGVYSRLLAPRVSAECDVSARVQQRHQHEPTVLLRWHEPAVVLQQVHQPPHVHLLAILPTVSYLFRTTLNHFEK
ncbi:unnamed protein product [Closterium sp. NIES-54]